MLIHNHYDLIIILEEYGIENMTPKNNSEMERHSAIHKTLGPDFIILP